MQLIQKDTGNKQDLVAVAVFAHLCQRCHPQILQYQVTKHTIVQKIHAEMGVHGHGNQPVVKL
jgi:hypothetical protein